MQNSLQSWQISKSDYYNQVSKIHSLIRNLDAELVQICNQCALPTSLASSSSNNVRNRSPNRMLANSNDSSNGLKTRTLSSIYRAKVIDAYRNRRIFTVYGNYNTVRRALLTRGWVEKLAPGRHPKLQGLSEEVLLQHAKPGNEYEAVAISKIISHFPAFFIWQSKAQRDLFSNVSPHRNRVRRARNLDFSTKVGLIGCAEQEPWYRQEGISGMSYPRFYRLGSSYEERMDFIEEFRQTQCRSLLLFVTENMRNPEDIIDEEEGTILLSTVTFAITRIKNQLGEWEHNALDDGILTNVDSDIPQWETFLANSNEVLQKKAKFKCTVADIENLSSVCKCFLDKTYEKCPNYKWDGCRNLWILKPGYQCRGIGITIKHSLDDILKWCSNNAVRKYIAQKYVERPLLIYKTKFDIRQYMLLTITSCKVCIWLYRDCYLRFSSQEYSVDDLRESIHLTNNSVQKKYKSKAVRDERLPRNNMWSLDQFKVYLKHRNAPENTWNQVIYAGFKENIIAVVLASLEETELTENAFELYGCDFMLDEQYHPILIEINSTPDLSPSTEITAQICPRALRDLIKVIVDLPRNSRASTGQFELVYEVNYTITKDNDTEAELVVTGTPKPLLKALRHPFRPRFIKKIIKFSKKSQNATTQPTPKKLKKIASSEKPKPSGKMESKASLEKKPLKGITKEALALRYTLPK